MFRTLNIVTEQKKKKLNAQSALGADSQIDNIM